MRLGIQIIIFLAAIENLLSRFAEGRAPVSHPKVTADGRFSETTRSSHARMLRCNIRYLNIIGVVVRTC